MSEAAFLACQNSIHPRAPSTIVADHGVALASLMRSMGITNCRSVDYKTDVFFATSQVGVSVGCEQLAVMATSIDHVQRVFQCACSSISQSTSTLVMNSNNIEVKVSDHAIIGCLRVEQTIQARIASSAEFGAVVQAQMANTLNDMVRSMGSLVQDASKDITTPQGQKSVRTFVQELEQTASQATFQEIVQQSINNFQSSNNFRLTLSDWAMAGLLSPESPQNEAAGCIVIVQQIMMQVMVQNMMDATLENVFSSDVAADFTENWIVSQKSVAKTTPSLLSEAGALITGSFLGLLLIGAIALGAFMLLKGGGQNPVMSNSSGEPGASGRTTAIVLIVIGILVFIFGIICFAINLSDIVGGIAIGVGVVMIGLGGYCLWKADQIAKLNASRKQVIVAG